MASNYPTSLDSFTDPTSGSSLASPSHSGQHIDLNDAVEKIEAKLGIGSSPASSATNGSVLQANGSGSTTWTANAVGLWLVKSETFTATSDLNIDNCFTTDFDNYRIVGRLSSSVNGVAVSFRWRTSAGDDTGAYYWRRGFYYTTGVNDLSQSGGTNDFLCNASNTASAITSFSMDVYSPYSSSFRTNANWQSYENNAPLSVWLQGAYVNPVSHTGISVYPASGTITGKLEIYGYRN